MPTVLRHTKDKSNSNQERIGVGMTARAILTPIATGSCLYIFAIRHMRGLCYAQSIRGTYPPV